MSQLLLNYVLGILAQTQKDSKHEFLKNLLQHKTSLEYCVALENKSLLKKGWSMWKGNQENGGKELPCSKLEQSERPIE